MIISLNKFKNKNTGSGGSGGGDVIINMQGLPFNEIGYDGNQQFDATTILMNDFQTSKEAYWNWDSNRTDAAYLFAGSTIEYGPAIDMTNVTNINGMYSNCRDLKYVPEIDLTNITEANHAFAACPNLNVIKFKGSVRDDLVCEGIFLETNTATVDLTNCNGNLDSIITQAQMYGNQILEPVYKNIAKFMFYDPSNVSYISGILDPTKNYAMVNGSDEKFPLRYHGDGNYKVILNEDKDYVQIFLDGKDGSYTVNTGSDVTINQEQMTFNDVMINDFEAMKLSSENVDFPEPYIMNINPQGNVEFKMEIPDYFQSKCSFEIPTYDVPDGNLDAVRLKFYAADHNVMWEVDLGYGANIPEIVNEIFYDSNDGKYYLWFRIENYTSSTIIIQQYIKIGCLTQHNIIPNDSYDIAKKILLFDNDGNKLTTSYESIIAHMDGDIYNTGDTYYNNDASVLKYNDPVENYIDEAQYVERYLINVPKYKKDFKFLTDEFPYVRCTVYDFNGKYTVLQKTGSWPMDGLAYISSQIYQKTEGVTMESSVVTIPAHGKVLFKRNSGKFFYKLTVNDLDGNVLDPTFIYTMIFEEDPDGNIQYYTAPYDGKQFFAGKYLYIENPQDYTVKVDITQNEDLLGNGSFIGSFDHYDFQVDLLDENGNWLNDTYDVDNHPITWTWGDVTGNLEKSVYNNFKCRIPAEFYWRFYENNTMIDVVLTLEDGTTYNFNGNTYMQITINTQN